MKNRLIYLMLHPQKGWVKISQQLLEKDKLIFYYLFPISFLSSLISFYRLTYIGVKYNSKSFIRIELKIGFIYGVVEFLLLILGMFGALLLINATINAFRFNFNDLIIYNLIILSSIPAFLGEIFYIFPRISSLSIFTQLYSIYLMYYGMKNLLYHLEEKLITLFIMINLILIFIFTIVFGILNTILINNF